LICVGIGSYLTHQFSELASGLWLILLKFYCKLLAWNETMVRLDDANFVGIESINWKGIKIRKEN